MNNTILGNHITTSKGFAFKSQWYTNVGIPLVKVSNFTQDSITGMDTFISKEIAEIYQKYRLKQGEVLIQTVGSWPTNPQSVVGKVVKVPEQCNNSLLNQNAVKIIPGKELDDAYLFYLLKSNKFYNYITSCATGSASQASITLEDIKAFEFVLPKLFIQKRISYILSSYDNLIENNNRRISILEEMAQRLYREWFVYFRFPGHENVKMTESELGLIPEGWNITEIGSMLSYNRGKSYKSSEINVEEGLPFINLKNISSYGGFNHDGTKLFNGTHKKSHQVVTGDVVMAVTDMTQERRLVGRVARIANLKSEYAVISMDLIKLVPNIETQLVYVYSLFRYSNLSQQIAEFANGANVLHLNPEVILQQNFIMPDNDIIDKFTRIIEPIYKQIDVIEEKNTKLRKTRDLLLPHLISGDIDVSELPIKAEED